MDLFASTSSASGHSVVLKGIYVYGNGNNFYQLMDPDDTSTVTVTVSDNALNNASYFTWSFSTVTFADWRYSYY